MPGHILEKKEEKRKKLLDSAYSLFVEQGISNTSISQICARAGVAKGTFYLYYQDKESILKALNIKFSYQILSESYQYMRNHRKNSFIENMITMAKHFIDRMKSDTGMVKMMKKDFVWDVTEESFMNSNDPLISDIRNEIVSYAKETGASVTSLLIRLFSMISMIFSVCYSCLVEHMPGEIDIVESEIYEMIRAVFRPNQNKTA